MPASTEQRIISKQLPISELKCDDPIQQRVALSSKTVSCYAQEMSDRGSERFPPVIVFRHGEDFWIADGFHRVKAAKQSGFHMFN